jgi:hypothetical protein
LKTRTCALTLASIISCCAVTSVSAQEAGNFVRDKAVGVAERPHPEYDSRGLRVGAFSLNPVLRFSAEHSDNIYGVATGEVGDTFFRIQPSATLQSNWTRHSLSLFANANVERYQDLSQENNTSWQVGTRGVLDLLRSSKMSGDASLSHFTEPRTSSNTVSTSVIPIEYDQNTINASGYREFNRVRVSAAAGWSNFSYDNGLTVGGVSIDQSYRDRDVTSLSARADYAVTPDTALYIKVAKDWRSYNQTAVLNRDSQGLQILVGADFELSNLVRGQVGVGYLKQSFDDVTLSDFSGYALNARVEWFPTQLVTVAFTAARTLQDSGLTGSAGNVTDQLGATVDYEFRRNVIITASAGYEHDNFLDLSRRDDRIALGLSATYLLNRTVGVTAGLSRLDQNSKGLLPGPDFTVNKASLGLILKY